MVSEVDKFRIEILKYLSTTGSFQKSWPVWNPLVSSSITQNNPAQSIFDLGEKLSMIFKANSQGGRSQSQISGGGAAWECLVTWYLNFVFFGTDVIATRQKKDFVPPIVSQALTVTIANQATNTESDIVIYKVPNASALKSGTLFEIEDHLRNSPTKTDIGVIQCKTNWNDNAQIPMLWDLIYNASSFKIPNVSVGTKGVSPSSFGTFSYAFMTVPTVKKDPTPKSLATLRVKNLTGGNYWGKQNTAGVASSINEYFTRNFSTEFHGGVVAHIKNSLQNHPTQLKAFLNLDFSLL